MKSHTPIRPLLAFFFFCLVCFFAAIPARAEIYKELEVGESYTLNNGNFANADYYEKTWSVSDRSVLEITPKGKRQCVITGLKPGVVRVTCKTNAYKYSSSIHGNPYPSSPSQSLDVIADSSTTYYEIEVKSPIRYTLKFNGNGGSVSKSRIVESKGSDIGTLPTAKRSGYLFSGWYTAKKGGKKITSATLCTGPRTYYARWKKVKVGRPSLKKLSPGYKTLQVSAGKVSGAKGYQLSYSLSSSMKNAKTVSSSRPTFQLRSLKPGKVYYVRVRAYKQDSAKKKIYGSWSSKKRVKIALAEISSEKSTLVVRQRFRLKLNGAKSGVRWSSSRPSVASVSSSGVVTGKAAGKTTITALYKGTRYRSAITVQAPRLSKSSLTLADGAASALSVKGTTLPVSFASSNSSVVSVSKNGGLTAQAPGTASVSAVVNGVSHTCRVTVAQPVMNHTSATLYRGDTLKLKVNNTARWTESFRSSNTNVAKVSSNGAVTAVGSGTAVITAVVYGKYYTCSVTVEEKILSAYASYTNTLFSTGRYRYDTTNQGKFTIRLLEYKKGAAANQYALRNSFNPLPAAGQEYILLKFSLTCLEAGRYGSSNSFYENLFCTTERIGNSNYYYTPFADASMNSITVRRHGLPAPEDANPSSISVGDTITCTVLLLTDSFNGPLTYSLATEGGNNEVWFTT